jgi:hypothetical protein
MNERGHGQDYQSIVKEHTWIPTSSQCIGQYGRQIVTHDEFVILQISQVLKCPLPDIRSLRRTDPILLVRSRSHRVVDELGGLPHGNSASLVSLVEVV